MDFVDKIKSIKQIEYPPIIIEAIFIFVFLDHRRVSEGNITNRSNNSIFKPRDDSVLEIVEPNRSI